MRRVQFDRSVPPQSSSRAATHQPITAYQPSWVTTHDGERISSKYDSIHTKLPQYEQHREVDGWQFDLNPAYIDNYPLHYDPSQPFLQTQYRLNEQPRTSIFETNQPIVLTSHDEIPTQKYTPHVVEEINDDPSGTANFPTFSNFEELNLVGNVQQRFRRIGEPSERSEKDQSRSVRFDEVIAGPKPISYLSTTVPGNSKQPKPSHMPIRSSARRPRDRSLRESLAGYSDLSFASQRSNDVSTSAEDIIRTGPRWRRVQDNPVVIPYDDIESYEKEFFIFYTKFKDPTFPHNLPRGIRWYNVPTNWESVHQGGLRVYPKSGTDFWQQTYFGNDESKDSGHFLYLPCTHSKVLLETSLTLTPRDQNDQAGVMIRYDRRNWIRAGLEFIDGCYQLTCVCTINGFSDWSIQEHKGGRSIEFKLYVLDDDVIIEHRSPHSENNRIWKILRVAHLDTKNILPKASQPEYERTETGQRIHRMVGLYTCRPSNSASDAISYVTYYFMSVRHCEQYERNEQEEPLQIPDDTYGNFRKIAGPFIADEDYFIEPDQPKIKTFEIY